MFSIIIFAAVLSFLIVLHVRPAGEHAAQEIRTYARYRFLTYVGYFRPCGAKITHI
jgi:hypothetical protein